MSTDEPFEFHQGNLPLLVSVPHDGRTLPPAMAADMTPAALALPDTDWHVGRLYGFCRSLGASLIVSRVSRYVVDLNRPVGDESLYPGRFSTGVCPVESFAGEPLYRKGFRLTAKRRAERVARFWRPYHDRLAAELERIRDKHGIALLWDAHSITSQVPRLFDGTLPELNLGSFDLEACDPDVAVAVYDCASASDYSVVHNGRFKGGYITRHYGRPSRGVHALQLELAQRSYMNEASLRYDPAKAERLRETLETMLRVFIDRGLDFLRTKGDRS